jgi:hypothetical protein
MRLVLFAATVGLLSVIEVGCTAGAATPGLVPSAGAHRVARAGNTCPNDTGGGMTGDSPCSVVLRHPI